MHRKDSLKNLSKPEKIYCENSNLMYALVSNPNTGTLRETFFANQLRSAGHGVSYPVQGDFVVDGRYLFEVGGEKKRFTQIKDICESYVVSDNIETGTGPMTFLYVLFRIASRFGYLGFSIDDLCW